MHAQWWTVLQALYLRQQPNSVCVYAQSQFFLHSQNDTNLAVGNEEAEN